MKFTIKKDSYVKRKDIISIDEINFQVLNILENIEEKSSLLIESELVNFIVEIKDNKNEEIGKIIDKIEKYQKSKMSSKEISKMITRISKYPNLSELISNMNNNEPLSDYMLSLLNLELVESEYYINLKKDNIKGLSSKLNSKSIQIKDEDELKELIIVNFNDLYRNKELQIELQFIFDEQEEEKIRIQKEKILKILGSNKKNKKINKKVKLNNVDEYLKEKLKLIEENATSSYHVDVEYPLPQANNLERIIELGNDIFNKGEIKINLEILENDLDKRDVHYYTRALCYLRLAKIDSKSRDLCLTYEGEQFYSSNLEERKDIIFGILNTDPLVQKIINKNIDLNNPDHVKEFEGRGISSDSTIFRRIVSLNSWINYLVN